MSTSSADNRLMFTAAGVLALSVSATRTAIAQTSPWEFRISSGNFVPTGEQRDILKSSQLTAVQLSWVVRPSLAVTGTFGWARSRDLTSAETPKLDVFTSDLGVEVRPAQWFSSSAVTLNSFVGIGGGARSYNYRKLDVAATHNLAGYGAVGGEIGIGRVGVRLEVRDYVAGFKPLTGIGASRARNDVVFTAALRFKSSGSQN
jgi:hypothetical protein